jgi:hypothetical protein
MLFCVLTLSNPPDRRGAPAAPLYYIWLSAYRQKMGGKCEAAMHD